MEYYATQTGTNPRQLEIRLAWLVREFARSTTPKPWQPARLDIRSEQARWVAEALLDAVRAHHEGAPKRVYLAALRRAENRWHTVSVDLFRKRTVWADLRPEVPAPLAAPAATPRVTPVTPPARESFLPEQRVSHRFHGAPPATATTETTVAEPGFQTYEALAGAGRSRDA